MKFHLTVQALSKWYTGKHKRAVKDAHTCTETQFNLTFPRVKVAVPLCGVPNTEYRTCTVIYIVCFPSFHLDIPVLQQSMEESSNRMWIEIEI